MSQADLARMTGMTQNNVSRLESPDYGKQTLSSLKRIADALDVALIVRFVPFSQYIDWLSGTPRLDEGLDSNAIAVSSFEKEEEANLFEQNAFLGQLIMTSVGITVSMYVFPSGIIQPATTFTYGKTQLNTTGLPLENGKHLEIIGASPLQNILPGYQCQQESEEFYARAK
jgi:transcriptional regulator with XRE-family HTH domain